METEESMKRIGAPDALSRIPAKPEFLSRGEVARLFGLSVLMNRNHLGVTRQELL
jgi:hypothetical protein